MSMCLTEFCRCGAVCDPETVAAQRETGMAPLARMTVRLRARPRPMISAPGNRKLSATNDPTQP